MTGPSVHGLVLASPDPGHLTAWYDEVLGPDRPGELRVEPGRVHPAMAREPMRVVPTFCVADAAAVERRLIAVGAVWTRELETTPWGRIATVLDPDGNGVQFIETRSAP